MANPQYYFCLGVILDGNYVEKTCKVRDNCKYYLHDLFRRFPTALGDGEMILNEPGKECTNYLQRQERIEHKHEDEDPFAIITK